MDTNNYAVIIDCGSSGSRAHIYTWPQVSDDPLLLPDIKPLKNDLGENCLKKIEPGLDSVEDEPDGASKYMGPLMDFIAASIPEDKHDDTHVYIMATGGLRLLGKRTQQDIMSDLEKDLPRMYKFSNIKAQVISGQDEGMYSWISVNFMAGRFDRSILDKRFSRKKQLWHNNDLRKNTVGIIDMGGASIQVAFEMSPSDGYNNNSKRSTKSTLNSQLGVIEDSIKEVDLNRRDNKHNYKLFVNTFLGIGSNSAREAATDLLVRSKMNYDRGASNFSGVESLTLLDPCLPKGATEVIKRPRVLLETDNSSGKDRQQLRQTIGFRYDEDEPSVDIILKGSGSMKQCMAHLIKLIDTAKQENMNCDNPTRCPMSLLGTNFIPFKSHHFYGLSDFYYSTKELIDSAGLFNRNQMISRTNRICLTPFRKLQYQFAHSNEHDPTRVLHECFKATWLLTFLEHGLHMPKQSRNFETVDEVNGKEINWTLGAMIEKSIGLEKESHE